MTELNNIYRVVTKNPGRWGGGCVRTHYIISAPNEQVALEMAGETKVYKKSRYNSVSVSKLSDGTSEPTGILATKDFD